MASLPRRIVPLEPGEGRAVAYSFAYFFCVLASNYVLRPLRDAMGVVGNGKDLSRLFLVTLAATLLFTPVLTAVVSRFPRATFLPLLYRFFAANLVVFFFLLRATPVNPMAARAFFVWTSAFNLFALSLFWGFMADIFRRDQGVRLFGFIGGGGTLGAMAGSLTTSLLVERIGAANLLLVSVVLLELAALCVRRLVALAALSPAARDASAASDAHGLQAGGTFAWIRSLAKSPYFLAIIAYMLFFTFTSTFVYFEQARIVKAFVASTEARTALLARVDLAVNVASFALQTLIAGPLLRALGVGRTLAILPLLTLLGFVALRTSPTLGVLIGFQVIRRVVDYGIAKPTREVLFTVVSREDKYKAKSFIDTFVYRGGDALGAASFEGLSTMMGSGLIAISAPLCLVWAAIALWLGHAATRQSRVASQTSLSNS